MIPEEMIEMLEDMIATVDNDQLHEGFDKFGIRCNIEEALEELKEALNTVWDKM